MDRGTKFDMVGMMREPAWIATFGNKVLCDKLVRVRRFTTENAAVSAAQKATNGQFY